jgi:FkbM family methyltransferase
MSVLHHASLLADLKRRGFVFETLFDVGANIGRWSHEAQKVFPDARFELFEPLAGRYAEVDSRSMVAAIPRATLHPVALSDTNGEGEIKILGGTGVGSSILVLEGDRKKDITIIPCEYRRLDDLVAEHGWPQVDFLKLDTQAAELKVLKGAVETLKKTQFLLLESWARRVYGPETPLFHELADWLYTHDFVLYDVLSLEDGRDTDGTLRWFDAVFVNKSASSFPKWML